MALIACKECGTEISTTAKACPKCGARVPKTKWWLWVPLGLVGAFLILAAIVGNSPDAQAKGRARRAIDFCWEEQKRKSLDPSAQQFAASTCEMMEADFMQKYGHRP